jgi:CheY-like chemotaxis protein
MPVHPVKAAATGKIPEQPGQTQDVTPRVLSSRITCFNPSARTLLVLLILLALNVVACYDAMLTLLLRGAWRIRTIVVPAWFRLMRPQPAAHADVIVRSFATGKSRRKILIVEDDPVTARAYAQCLLRAGYEVKLAGTGSAALGQVASWQPDGVLLDVLLPELNGIQVLTRLHAAAPDLPVVICTNIFKPAVEQSALAAGATRIFDKSTIKAADLVSEFDRVFEQRAAGRLAA